MFENEKLGVKFSLPDPLRMRDIEVYETARDEAKLAGAQFAPAINWLGAIALLNEWECEELKDPKELSLEDLADSHGKILQIVYWVGGQVYGYVIGELFVPKN